MPKVNMPRASWDAVIFLLEQAVEKLNYMDLGVIEEINNQLDKQEH
jgi:hypothetical protein